MPHQNRSTVQDDVWTRDSSAPTPSIYERHPTQLRGISDGPFGGIRPDIVDSSLPPTGAGPSQTTIVQSAMKAVPDSDIYRVGIYGWRKRCLYCFILILTLIIVVNLVLTVWIMIVLNFGVDGMGALKVTNEGIRVTGKTKFEKPVQFSQISTENNKALTLDSALGVSLSAHNLSGDTTAFLDLSSTGKVSASCERFEVVDRNNKLLFFADSNEVGLKLNNLRVLDDGGTVFEGAIQTGTIRPEPDTPLSLESPTRGVKISAGQDIELLSSSGEFSLNALEDINLISKKGDIHLDGNMYISGLERSHGRGTAQYQLCICQNGRIFMVAENADCRADKSICE